jgi:hypothetical protein
VNKEKRGIGHAAQKEAVIMAHVKLSQWEAILLEVLRAHGTEDQEIIDRFKSGDIRPFQQIEDGRFDFAHLLDLAQSQWDLFERAVRDGYQIKFSTFNGIKTLLSLKFQQQAERDYAVHEDYLERVRLKQADVEWLRSTISPNWQIIETERRPDTDEVAITIALARP